MGQVQYRLPAALTVPEKPMKSNNEILAPLLPFLADESVTSLCISVYGLCITVDGERDLGHDDGDEDDWRRGDAPKTPGPMPSPALA
jgi:hypothetical protein